MRKVIYKSNAIKAVILILAVIAIISVFPLRVWNTTITSTGGGTIAGESGEVNDSTDVVPRFVAQYDRIGSIDVYVTSLDAGRYMTANLYNQNMELIFYTYVDLGVDEVNGYVSIPLKVDLEVGETYTLLLVGNKATFKVAYEDIPAEPAYVGDLLYHDSTVGGFHLAARYNYSVPLSKTDSVKVMGVIAAAAIVLVLIFSFLYKKKIIKDKLITQARAFKFTLNPIVIVAALALMIMIYPMKLFDLRLVEILFYELGVVIATAITLFAINHRYSFAITDNKFIHLNVKNCLMIIAISCAIGFGIEYMNALYTIYQTLAERKELIALLCVIILTFSFKELFNVYNLIYMIIAVIYGRYYYVQHALAETEKEYELQNPALCYAIIIAILTGIILINFISIMVKRVVARLNKKAVKGINTISFAGVVTLVFFVCLMIMRNTRWWGVVLSLVFTAFYVRFNAWKEKKEFSSILVCGMMLNFISCVIYSLLFRYMQAFREARFALVFHTVTVTAEYLTAMEVMAIVLLLLKLNRVDKELSFKNKCAFIWKEWTFLGVVSAYVLFTLSRTAFLAIFVTSFIVWIIMSTWKNAFKNLLVILSAVIIVFPAMFTLQRTIPVMVARPYFYLVEDKSPMINGGVNWDNTELMCIERYVGLFGSKILGLDEQDYDYPEDKYNYDSDGNPLYLENGVPVDSARYDGTIETNSMNLANAETQMNKDDAFNVENAIVSAGEDIASFTIPRSTLSVLLAEASEVSEETAEEEESALEEASNGRFAIFRSYIKELDMTGHDEMGAELENGEIAVHAHNIYIQVAYDHGIPVGILFIFWILTILISGFIRIRKHNDQKVEALPFVLMLGFAVAGVSEWLFQFSNPITIMMMLSLAPLMFISKKAGGDNSKN